MEPWPACPSLQEEGWTRSAFKVPCLPGMALSPGDRCCSVAQSCPTLCSPMDCSTLGLPVHHQLPELAQTHVRLVGDAIQPSHPPTPLLLPLIFPSIRVFASELALHIRRPKYWSFSISPSSEYSGLISLQMDWLDLLAAQGLSRTSSPYPWAGLDSQGPGQCVSSAPCRQSRGESSMSPSWGAQGPGGSGTVASFRGLIHCPPRQQQLVSASGPQSPVTVLRVPPRGREEPL